MYTLHECYIFMFFFFFIELDRIDVVNVVRPAYRLVKLSVIFNQKSPNLLSIFYFCCKILLHFKWALVHFLHSLLVVLNFVKKSICTNRSISLDEFWFTLY